MGIFRKLFLAFLLSLFLWKVGTVATASVLKTDIPSGITSSSLVPSAFVGKDVLTFPPFV